MLRRRPPQYLADDVVLAHVWPGIFIYLDAKDISLTPTILRRGIWETPVALAIIYFLRRGGTFLDVGANCGYHGLVAAWRTGEAGKVIACEPQRDLCVMLERSVAANRFMPRMQVHRLALGAGAGTGSLGKPPLLSGSASFCFGDDVTDREEVPIVDLPGALGIASDKAGCPVVPDVIKIDVEGFEFDVWNGMKEWTRTRRELTIILEFSPFSYRNAGQDPAELLRQFREYGFTISRLRRFGMTRLDSESCAQVAAADRQVDLVLRKVSRR